VTPAPFYLWRYARGKPIELVAIVNDESMALAWVKAGESRRWTRLEFGQFSAVR